MTKGSAAGRAALAALVLGVAACGQKAAKLQLTPAKVTLYGKKKSAGLTATVFDKKGMPIPGLGIQWEAVKPNIATVENGVVKSVNPGKTLVTAKLEKTILSANCNVEVIDVASITLTPSRMTFAGAKGSTLKLSAEVRDSTGKLMNLHPEWNSSNPKVASVDKSGVVTSNAEGKATITASLGDFGAGTELRILFREIETFQATPETMLLRIRETQRINLMAKDKNGVTIEDPAAQWISSDPNTATCSNGAVTGVAKGAATIKVICGNHTGEVSVIVN